MPTRTENTQAKAPRLTAKDKLLAAAFGLIRAKGYSSTTVDDLCAEAGVTKGSFFHYFDTKEALAVAAAQHWAHVTGDLFASAPYHAHADPLDRLLGYIDFRRELLRGDVPEFTCLVGTMVQEAFESHPEIRKACEASIVGHTVPLERDIAEAIRKHKPAVKIDAKSLALHTQAVLQGAFILAKASGGPRLAVETVDHLQNYVRLLFKRSL